MKKKIILILSIIVLCVSLFAIAISAEEFNGNSSDVIVSVDLPSHFIMSDGSSCLPIIICDENGLNSNYLNDYTFYYDAHAIDDTVCRFELIYMGIDSEGVQVLVSSYNLKIFKSYLESKNVVDFSTFNAWRQNLDADDDFLKFIKNTVTEEIYNDMFNFEEAPIITEADLTAKYTEGYSQGKIDGVIEYKSSEEYTTALNNKYATGYTEGIESFKASTAYTDALDLQFSNGKTAGVTEYKASTEYANVLKAEYDEGYDNGVTDTQGENTKNETTKLISILIGVLGFGILFMAVLSGVGAFKKKRAKRR